MDNVLGKMIGFFRIALSQVFRGREFPFLFAEIFMLRSQTGNMTMCTERNE